MVFVSILGVLPKSLSVLLVQVAVSQQVAAAQPEVEDDKLSNTMFIDPFSKDDTRWITRMNKERDSFFKHFDLVISLQCKSRF